MKIKMKREIKFDFMANGTIKEQMERKIVEIKEMKKSETKIERLKGVQFIDNPIYKAKEAVNKNVDKVINKVKRTKDE